MSPLPPAARRQFERAVALFNAGELASADGICSELIAQFPSDAEVTHLGGVVANRMGRYDVAVQRLGRAVQAQPGRARAHAALGLAFERLGDFEGARRAFAAAIGVDSKFAEAHNGLGVTLLRMGLPLEALPNFDRAIALDPQSPEAYLNAARALEEAGRPGDAVPRLRAAMSLARGRGAVLRICAQGLLRAGEPRAAVEALTALVQVEPNDAQAHSVLGTELLGAGELERGWREHLYRPSRGTEIFEQVSRGRYPPPLPARLEGAGIVILMEQGLGDLLFFLRFARPLADAGARLHVMRMDPRLEAMVSRALSVEYWPIDREVPAGATVVWSGDLPLFVRPLTGSDVAPSLRIAALPDRVERMKARLGNSPRRRVGVAWRAGTPKGSALPGQDLLSKEIDPHAFGEALRGAPIDVVSLQRQPSPEAVREIEEALGARLVDCADVNGDLEDMLALLSILDDYAGVSSTNVHLLACAGGTGRILVPYPPDWRWQRAGESVWFPGFKTYRQSPSGAWTDALAALREDLAPEAKK